MLLPERSSSQRIQAVFTSAPAGLEGFKAHAVFQEIAKKLQEEGDQFVKKIGGVFAFKVKDGPGGSEAMWIVDVKEGKGCVHNDTYSQTAPEPSCSAEVTVSAPCVKAPASTYYNYFFGEEESSSLR
ncbi:hypothetical protein SRHO_G00141860 [Serrasalmus rhombeus]